MTAQTLRLTVTETDVDAERLDRLTFGLQEEILELNVDDVSQASAGEVPAGARGLEAVDVGTLVVTLGQSAVSLKSVLDVVESWLTRSGGTQRTARLEMDGDTIELSSISKSEQTQFVELFLARHSRGGEDRWTDSARP
jgi:hypothetical protein